VPAADPNLSGEGMRLQQAVALREAAATNPAYKRDAVERNFLRALGVDAPDEYYGSVEDIPPAKDPKIVVEEMRDAREKARMQLDAQTFAATLEQTERLNNAKILELEAKVAQILDAVDGEEEAAGLERFRAELDAAKTFAEMIQMQREAAAQAASAPVPSGAME
jgi:hypothetical protein